MKYEVLAIIPARGGSRKVPRKNLRLLGDRPLIVYSIDAALRSHRIDRVIVSTDSEEIAVVAREAGVKVPFLRPSEFAQDDSPDYPVFRHALAWLQENENYCPDIIVNLRPTSPFRRVEDIDGAVDTLIETAADSVKTVSLASQHPHKMWHMGAHGMLSPFLQSPFRLARGPDVPRQELEPVYWQNGSVDVTWRRTILEQETVIGSKVAGYLTPDEFSFDLDEEFDFLLAEALLRVKSENE